MVTAVNVCLWRTFALSCTKVTAFQQRAYEWKDVAHVYVFLLLAFCVNLLGIALAGAWKQIRKPSAILCIYPEHLMHVVRTSTFAPIRNDFGKLTLKTMYKLMWQQKLRIETPTRNHDS